MACWLENKTHTDWSGVKLEPDTVTLLPTPPNDGETIRVAADTGETGIASARSTRRPERMENIFLRPRITSSEEY